MTRSSLAPPIGLTVGSQLQRLGLLLPLIEKRAGPVGALQRDRPRLNAPQSLEAQIAGESLVNDGVGVIVFLTLASMAGAGRRNQVLEEDHEQRADTRDAQHFARRGRRKRR